MNDAVHLRGVVLPDGVVRDVFVAGGEISFGELPDARTLIEDCFLIPGLVDAHAHLALASPSDGPPAERVRASARAHLDAGVLLVREPGGPDRSSAGLGPHEGLPRVISGGRFLAPPNGYFPGLAREVHEDRLPDAAAEEAEASDAWAKVIGDFLGPDRRPRRNWKTETLIEAARRVHAVGARITIHAMTAETVEQAIEADFDAVEHGMAITEDQARAMAARGMALVPTLFPLGTGIEFASSLDLPDDELTSMIRLFDDHAAHAMRAADLGVDVYAGTDAGMGAHGQIASQIRLMIEAGFPTDAALASASWSARAWLGLPGIEEGAPADIVAFRDDPRSGPEALTPAVTILNGVLVRSLEG